MDIKQHHENDDIQIYASDFYRKSSFNRELQMNSNKKIESFEMPTQVQIHNVDSNSKHDLDETSAQPFYLLTSRALTNREKTTMTDGDLNVIKPLKLQTHTSLHEQVLN